MKNNIWFVIFLLVFAFKLFAIGLSEKDLSLLENDILKNIPESSSIYLKCNEQEIDSQLIPFLINKKYKVLSKYHPDSYLIEINVVNKNIEKNKKVFFIKTKVQNLEMDIECKIINPKESEIVYYKKFQYIKKISENRTNWYEPALITTIVGGLAYLFYFGTN